MKVLLYTNDEDKTYGITSDKVKKFDNLLPLIKPKISPNEIRLMSDKPIREIKTYLIPALQINCDRFNILIELVQGKVIQNIDSDSAADVPDLSKLSPNQLGILSIALELKEFGMAHIINKGFEFHHTQNILKDLIKQDLIICENQTYKLNPNLALNLEKFNFFGRIEFDNIEYDTKISPKITKEETISKIKPLTKIQDSRECFIVWHKVEYE